jgi:hypothetical protein
MDGLEDSGIFRAACFVFQPSLLDLVEILESKKVLLMLIRNLVRQVKSCGDLYAATDSTANDHLETGRGRMLAGIRSIDKVVDTYGNRLHHLHLRQQTASFTLHAESCFWLTTSPQRCVGMPKVVRYSNIMEQVWNITVTREDDRYALIKMKQDQSRCFD